MAGYVPDGMSPEQYRKIREKEKAASKQKNLGAFGPQSFQSRSMQSFQQDLEKGKASHLMPVFNAKEKLKKGKLKEADIPYMQRLGSWDNSDLGKKKAKKKSALDQRYNQNERPAGVDWMGRNQQPNRPVAAKKGTNAAPPPKKKLFGLF